MVAAMAVVTFLAGVVSSTTSRSGGCISQLYCLMSSFVASITEVSLEHDKVIK